jgi:DNA-binding transcriptional ArsR family regulator
MDNSLNMDSMTDKKRIGWELVQPICLELDTGLAIASGQILAAGLAPEFHALQQKVTPDWKKDIQTFTGDLTWNSSCLEYAALLSGVFDESDYSTATLMIRQTTVKAALDRLIERAAEVGIQPVTGLPVEETLIQLFLQYRKSAFESIGLIFSDISTHEARFHREMKLCCKIFKHGSLHDRFWHWMDRFYFEFYRHWREERKLYLVELEQKLVTMLGVPANDDRLPEFHWLPDQSPALRYSEIGNALSSGSLFVKFWLEPFGFADNFVLLPGQIYLSFAEPGKIYENFLVFSRELANRAQALADPTRLIILRMIRELSMTNTDMAAYLGVSRPTVSIHAKVLREAGLIRSWEDGRITRHEVNHDAISALFHDLEQFLDLTTNS